MLRLWRIYLYWQRWCHSHHAAQQFEHSLNTFCPLLWILRSHRVRLGLKRGGPWLTYWDQRLQEEKKKKSRGMSIWIFTDCLRTSFTTHTAHSNLLLHSVMVLASLSSPVFPHESTRSWYLQLLNSVLVTSLQWMTLKSRVYILGLKESLGRLVFSVCFIASSVNYRIVFQRRGNEIVMSTWWNNGDCVVDWLRSGWREEVMSLTWLPQWNQL